MNDYLIEFSGFILVNDLWPKFVQKLGLDKARLATRQASDLQNMHGNQDTLPVLIAETCGIALIDVKSLHQNFGLSYEGGSVILFLSTTQKSFQILQEN